MNIHLPKAPCFASLPLETIIANRRSHREFSASKLTLQQVSQLLWSANGISGDSNYRSSPSAGAQYPIEVYAVARQVENVPGGFYRYNISDQTLQLLLKQDPGSALSEASLDHQPWVAQAALTLILVADFQAMQKHFHNQPPIGKRGDRYIFMESGAMAQNVLLQATALDLGAVLIGGFDNHKVSRLLSLPTKLEPTTLICIGVRK
ncbi:MAG: SagB-type dehydrogenase family enzyme [Parasphingorhabdus sp.]|jgi:SagB-type dehydrogenase family enzyme